MTQTTSWKHTGLRLLVVLVTFGVAISGAAGVLAAPPQPPHDVDGVVQDQNGDSVSGVTVQAVYDGEVIAETTTGSNGEYEFKVSDPNETATNEQVTIRVASHSADETITWESGGTSDIDFQITVQEETTEPPSDGDDGGSGDGGTGDGGTGDGGTGDGGTGDGGTGDGDQPTTDQPTTDQPTTDQPTTDQPTTAGPTSEQPTTEGPTDTTAGGTTSTSVDTTSDDTTGGFIPGFTGVTAILAVLGSLLLLRRRDD